METATRSDIGAADFYADPHAAKYQGELEAHPDAFQNLFELLNTPEQRPTLQSWPAACVLPFLQPSCNKFMAPPVNSMSLPLIRAWSAYWYRHWAMQQAPHWIPA